MARHEQVLVLNRGAAGARHRPPGHARAWPSSPWPAHVKVAVMLAGVLPVPDPDFAADMEAVTRSVGPVPGTPWERS